MAHEVNEGTTSLLVLNALLAGSLEVVDGAKVGEVIDGSLPVETGNGVQDRVLVFDSGSSELDTAGEADIRLGSEQSTLEDGGWLRALCSLLEEEVGR